jgi:hypothetical protein
MVYQIQVNDGSGWRRFPSGKNSMLHKTQFKKKSTADSYMRALREAGPELARRGLSIRLIKYSRYKSPKHKRTR